MSHHSSQLSSQSDFSSDFERQIHWEMQSVDRGIDRYRQTLVREKKDHTIVDRNVADLRPGAIIIRDIVSRAEEVIAQEQRELMEYLESATIRKWTDWWWPFLHVPAGQIAYIGAKAILQGASDPQTATLRAIGFQIAGELKTQREYTVWKEDEERRERQVKADKADGVIPEDQYVPNWWKLMYQLSDQSARAYRKFAKKSERMVDVGWSYTLRLSLGAKVVETIYRASGGWFEVRDVFVKGTMQKEIKLTPEAWGWIEDQHSKNEMLRPWLLPMRIEPLDWVRREGSVASSTQPV